MTKKQKEVTIPDNLLAQIDEFSIGGFMLFTFDTQGNPKVHTCFDNAISASAMMYYASNWTKAMDSLNTSITANAILNQGRKRK